MNSRGISLANKCQILFGLAVLLILTAALSVPWLRMQRMVSDSRYDALRLIADAWRQEALTLPTPVLAGDRTLDNLREAGSPDLAAAIIPADRLPAIAESEPLLADAIHRLDDAEPEPWFASDPADQGRTRYLALLPLSRAELRALDDPEAAALADLNPQSPGPPAWLCLQSRAEAVRDEVSNNRTYILLAGILAGFLAILVFYVITTRLILSPVRILRETAERVSRGDLNIRSDIPTGDEFQELSDTFNLMLTNLKSSQDQLRQINKSMDLKLAELAETNVMLNESNRLKSEFLANVSHELRTPLNSIIGFAEVIADTPEPDPDDPLAAKRRRYLENILNSGRSLLALINDLLDLAKIEAGRMEVQPEPTSVAEVCEAIATLMRPQADKKHLTLSVNISQSVPSIETDPAKFQQIVFNLVSNAVKFTPEHGSVTISAQREWRTEAGDMIRISVADTGPGIRPEDQQIIFEKFRQIDASHTRHFAGTGLGLAICRELATLLGGSIALESEPGRGTTFHLRLPLVFTPVRPQSLIPA